MNAGLKKTAMRIRARAIQRCGQLLSEFEKKHGANQNIRDGAGPKVQTRRQAAVDAGLSERQAKTTLRVANVPEDEFDRQVDSENPPTITALAKKGKRKELGKISS